MSELENLLAFHIKLYKLPKPIQQYKFHPARKWHADFAWIDQKVICEVQGGVWNQGRHTRGGGYIKDCEKMNEAVILGWKYLKVCKNHIDSGEAVRWIQAVLYKGI